MAFLDRRDAGCRLAEHLTGLASEHPLVVALAPGGVPVAFEIARRLRAPLDVIAVAELGVSGEVIGAIAEDGTVARDAEVAPRVSVTEDVFDAAFARTLRELRRTAERYRGSRRAEEVGGRTVILVGDGGDKAPAVLAGVRSARARGAACVVIAVPAIGTDAEMATLATEADGVVCHTLTIDRLVGGVVYKGSSPVSEAEVIALLEVAARLRTTAPGQMPPPERVAPARSPTTRRLHLDLDGTALTGELTIPDGPRGLVLFAEDAGLSMRNCRIAAVLQNAGVATLVVGPFDEHDGTNGHHLGLPALADHLAEVTRSVLSEPQMCDLPVGVVGLSAAGAAVHAAVTARDLVQAIVLLDGPAKLALDELTRVEAATLLVVGGRDREGLEWARGLSRLLRCVHHVAVVEGTGRLFGEPGSLETAARLATNWFLEHLGPARPLAPTESAPRDFSDWELAVPPMDS